MTRKSTDYIIIHCADTPPDMDIDAKEIDRWHRARGFLKIGYHFVIKRDGTVEEGRKPDEPGAHAKGYNHKSIGICLVGGAKRVEKHLVPENNFTDEQWAALKALLHALQIAYPKAEIIGHRDVEPHKACPSFDVKEWVASLN